jgi:hypothetical protein
MSGAARLWDALSAWFCLVLALASVLAFLAMTAP